MQAFPQEPPAPGGEDAAAVPSLPKLRFRLPMEPARLLRARERIRDYLRVHCVDEELVDDVVLCIEEACTNAIRHSGSQDELQVWLAFEGEALHAEVKDRGRGFDVRGFDPARMPAPMDLGGRGLYLISQIMDEVRLRRRPHGGLAVSMVKRPVREPRRLHARERPRRDRRPGRYPPSRGAAESLARGDRRGLPGARLAVSPRVRERGGAAHDQSAAR